MKKVILASFAALSLAIVSCGDTNQNTATAPATTATEEMTIVDGKIVLELYAGDDMKFNTKVLKAKVGQPVKLSLKHTGTAPVTSMGHNVVILKPEASVGKFANAAIDAKETAYIPAGFEQDVVAHTKMLGGGESDTIEFTFEAAGEYVFMCSFPGHSALMKGIVKVSE